jgi:ribonuclease P protein component
VTWRITDRATFESFKRSGRFARSGPVSVVYLDDDGDRARVAYAVGRRAGGAVERNRLRRRLRAVVRTIESDGELRSGAYLVAPRREAADLGHMELTRTLREAMKRAQLEAAPPPRSRA